MSLHLLSKLKFIVSITLFAVLTALLPLRAVAQPTVMILGDSLSAGYGIRLENGWVNLLRQDLKQLYPELDLVNASISGETTGGALRRLPELLSVHQPDLVLVELGGNDGLRGFPISTLGDNLSQIVSKIETSGARALLLEIQLPPNYGRRYTQLFTGVFPKVAEQSEIALIPFFLEELATQPNMMQADGIHPTEKAQPQMAQLVKPHIERALALLAANNQPD